MKTIAIAALCAVMMTGCSAFRSPEVRTVTEIKRVPCPPEPPETECPVLNIPTPGALPELAKDYNIVWEGYEACFGAVALWRSGYDDCQESLSKPIVAE